MNDPIIIIGTPRSFTSLTSGILRDHGVWFGQDRGYHEYCPTGSCENYEMKKILKANRKGAVAKGEVKDPIEGFKGMIMDIMEKEGYSSGPYAFKHSAMFWKFWCEFNPRYICCRRPKEAVCKSGERSYMFAANSDSWEKHQEAMDEVVSSGKGVNVYGEEFFKEDWSSLEQAFEFCGLEFNVEIAENLIDHKHKHF